MTADLAENEIARRQPAGRLKLEGNCFTDEAGRMVMLRGVNLGGDSKVPSGGAARDFSDHKDVSFIGRPFPMEEAHEHFARLRHWGFNCIRMLTTWEAIEHSGPGQYDQGYLDYFEEVCALAGEFGLHLFVDMHQDVWSRMSGGDGAPGWTFDTVGLDFSKFDAAGAANIMQARYDYERRARHDPHYSQMSWGGNYYLPANGIMWTLFWGGAWITPQFSIDGRNVQHWLQDHYLGAMGQIAARLKNQSHVVGFDTLNEPSHGWLGQSLSHGGMTAGNEPEGLRPGPRMSPLDQLALSRGLPVHVEMLERCPQTGQVVSAGPIVMNQECVSIWQDGFDCPFEAAGIYRIEGDHAISLDENRFRLVQGRKLDIANDIYGGFFQRVAETVRAEEPQWAIFAEIDAMGTVSGRKFPNKLPPRTVNASHWYDVGTLFRKRFDPNNAYDPISKQSATSPEACRARFIRQLALHAAHADRIPGGAPTLIGEFGVPFDLNDAESYEAWSRGERGPGVFARQVAFLSLVFDALDHLGLHSTLWNYTAANSNDPAIGDGWNQEDLSIFSIDQQEDRDDLDSGGRAIEGFCRPYARHVQGRLRKVSFDRCTGTFDLEFDADPGIGAPTEVFVPRRQFPNGFTASCENCAIVGSHDAQITLLRAERSGMARLSLRRT